MRTRSAGGVFSKFAAEVELMVDAGLSFSEVEAAVEDSGLSEDCKSALWLIAWSRSREGAGSAGRPSLLPA